MSERPALDPEIHEDDTVTSVWKRRVVLILLIILVVAVAAPTFGGCSGSLSSKTTVATFEVGGRTYTVKDEELARFVTRYAYTIGLLDGQRLPEGEDSSKLALLNMMLDASAKAAGVHVPDDRVIAEIERHEQFKVGGKFDARRYHEAMSEFSHGSLSHEAVVDVVRTRLRVSEFVELARVAAELAPGDAAYDAWKKQNLRISALYVASPFETQKAKFDAIEPTAEDLAKIAGLPAVKALLVVPQRKTIEVAYLKAADLSPEQFAAAKKFAEDAEIFTDEQPLQNAAFILFHENRDYVFTKANWVRLANPNYEKEHQDWLKVKEEWEKKPAESRGTLPEEPKDPGQDYPATDKQFPLWKERAEKEALARAIIAHLGRDAERDGKTLTEAGAEYARFGVKVVKNAEPLADSELVEKFPDPVARDSEFDQIAVVEFKPLPEGATFKPRYHAKPMSTTRLAERIDDRGYMVARLDSCDAARQFTIEERRQPVVDFWRTYQTAEGARALAEDVRKKAEAAGPEPEKMAAAMRQAAADAGLAAETLTRVNRETDAVKPPTAEPGQTLSPELTALARKMALRNRVQSDYQLLAGLAVGKLRDPILVDEKLGAAIAVLVTEKTEPKPVEMSDDDLRNQRLSVAGQIFQKSFGAFDFDAVSKRLNLQRFDQKPAKSEKTDPPKSADR
jgi:hypothetical protein